MSKCKVFVCGLIYILSLSCLFGCSSYVLQKDDFYAGETVTPEQIEIIKDSISDSETEKFLIESTTLCYWTSGGTKFHLFSSCQSLSRTDPTKLITGIYDYIKDERECCSHCLKKAFPSE